MNWKILKLYVICLAVMCLALSFCQAAYADGGEDESEQQAVVESEGQVEETQESAEAVEPAVDREPGEAEYLDDVDMVEGDIGFVFKLSEDGEDSYFFRRYQDPFEGDWLYLNNFNYRGRETDGSLLGLEVGRSWDSSYSAMGTWINPGFASGWASIDKYSYYEIPHLSEGDRLDCGIGFQAFSGCSDIFGGSLMHRESTRHFRGENFDVADWQSSDLDLSYGFDLGDWNGSVEFNHRDFNDRNGQDNDAAHTSGLLRVGRDLCDRDYVEGSLMYMVSRPDQGNDLRNFRLGGYGRFMNALGVDRLNVTSHFAWDKRSDGPSVLHPAGDSFNFDIGGRWRAAPELSLYGSWDYKRSEVTWADQYTDYQYYLHNISPDLNLARWFEETITSNRMKLGGQWDITEGLDFNIDLSWLDRDGVPMTDWGVIGSPTLWWETEDRYIYTLRYNQGYMEGTDYGDWLLKYETIDRSNGARDSISGVERLSVNWTGMISPELYVYLGTGYLRTDQSVGGVEFEDQNGSEYGGGWSLAIEEQWDFFGDYWRYDTGGVDGYDQTSFCAGLGYEPDEEWEWTLEYRSVDGKFNDLTNLDYEINDLLLGVNFRW